jgi:outer membrane protein OmpA-like peptidoglycan-associated protein
MPDAGQSAGLNGLAPFLSGGEPDLEYVFVLDGVQFDPASATLRSTSNAQLAQLARVLTDFPEARLTIEAHEVAAGAEEARARALAVRAAIAALGVQPSRMRHAGVNGASRSSVEVRVTRE